MRECLIRLQFSFAKQLVEEEPLDSRDTSENQAFIRFVSIISSLNAFSDRLTILTKCICLLCILASVMKNKKQTMNKNILIN